MRKIFTILIVVMSIITIKGQDFAPIGAEWHYEELFRFSGATDYIKIASEKDTVILGETCRKITKRHKLFCNDRPDVEYLFTRNDTVFFLDTTFNKFQILYDFNAGQNSSWIIETRDESMDIDTLTITVDSISTTQINGQSLKIMHVTYVKDDENQPRTYNSTITEKLGDIEYMFNWDHFSFTTCDGNYSNGIRCYQDGSFGLYSSGLADSCNHASSGIGIEDLNAANLTELFPNPAQDFLDVRFKNQSNYVIELFDLNGQIVKSYKDYGSNFKLDLTEVKRGLYLLRVLKENRLVSIKKLIKE